MRELIEKGKKITVVPSDFKCANKGVIVNVEPKYFTIELEYEPKGMLRHNYCEFYTQTNHGTLYFDSYPETIDGNRVKIATPAKHRFLQRRQYTRIKFVQDLKLLLGESSYDITTVDISAGGMKLKTKENINIEGSYAVSVPLFEDRLISCTFEPIRIEKASEGEYIISGQFVYGSGHDKMILTQFCAKRSVEIKNK